MKEVEDLRDGRERQKEMVEAIVQQRDMYRTLLAQSTPLPLSTTKTKELLLTQVDIWLAISVAASLPNNVHAQQINYMTCTCTFNHPYRS